MKKKATVFLLSAFLLVFALVPPASAQDAITITKPLVEYEAATQTIDITGVNATCTSHGILTTSTALIHTYQVYYNSTGATVLGATGDLVWNNTFWNAYNVPFPLPPGDYHVDVTFNCSHVTATTSADSDAFTIGAGGGGGTGHGYWPFAGLCPDDLFCRFTFFVILVILFCFCVFIGAIWPTRGRTRVK
jgi:hypothetical protein